MKKIVGYITSSLNNGNYISHANQNLVIKNFLDSINVQYLLSWTEFKNGAPAVFLNLLDEKFYDGICFFSIDQLLESATLEACIFQQQKNWIAFANEKIIINDKLSFEFFEKIWKVKSVLNMTPSTKELWNSLESL